MHFQNSPGWRPDFSKWAAPRNPEANAKPCSGVMPVAWAILMPIWVASTGYCFAYGKRPRNFTTYRAKYLLAKLTPSLSFFRRFSNCFWELPEWDALNWCLCRNKPLLDHKLSSESLLLSSASIRTTCIGSLIVLSRGRFWYCSGFQERDLTSDFVVSAQFNRCYSAGFRLLKVPLQFEQRYDKAFSLACNVVLWLVRMTTHRFVIG